MQDPMPLLDFRTLYSNSVTTYRVCENIMGEVGIIWIKLTHFVLSRVWLLCETDYIYYLFFFHRVNLVCILVIWRGCIFLFCLFIFSRIYLGGICWVEERSWIYPIVDLNFINRIASNPRKGNTIKPSEAKVYWEIFFK